MVCWQVPFKPVQATAARVSCMQSSSVLFNSRAPCRPHMVQQGDPSVPRFTGLRAPLPDATNSTTDEQAKVHNKQAQPSCRMPPSARRPRVEVLLTQPHAAGRQKCCRACSHTASARAEAERRRADEVHALVICMLAAGSSIFFCHAELLGKESPLQEQNSGATSCSCCSFRSTQAPPHHAHTTAVTHCMAHDLNHSTHKTP